MYHSLTDVDTYAMWEYVANLTRQGFTHTTNTILEHGGTLTGTGADIKCNGTFDGTLTTTQLMLKNAGSGYTPGRVNFKVVGGDNNATGSLKVTAGGIFTLDEASFSNPGTGYTPGFLLSYGLWLAGGIPIPNLSLTTNNGVEYFITITPETNSVGHWTATVETYGFKDK